MEETNRQTLRGSILAAYGADVAQVEELLAYSDYAVAQQRLEHPLALPLEPELHVATWRQYAAIAHDIHPQRCLHH